MPKQKCPGQKKHMSTQEALLTASPPPLILRLAVPAIISHLVDAFYNFADTYFVSGLGTSATGAVGVAYPMMTIVFACGLLMGKGAGVSLSHALGANDREKAERIVADGMMYMLAIGVILAVICQLFVTPIAHILGATSTMLPLVRIYLRYISFALPFKAASVMLGCFFRFQGKFMKSMLGMGAGAVLNIILDPLFIYVLDMGVSGAALATAIGQFVSFVILMCMSGKDDTIPVRLRKVCFSLNNLRHYLEIGFPSLLKNSLSSVAAALMNTAAAVFGDPVVAAMTIAYRTTNVLLTAYFGMTESLQTFAGYNFGAKQYSRVNEARQFVQRFGTYALGGCAVLLFIFARPIVSCFDNNPAVINNGVNLLRAQSITLPILSLPCSGFVLLQAIGENRRATIVGTGRQALFLIPFALVFPRVLGITGLILIQPLSDICSSILTVFIIKPVTAFLRQPQLEDTTQE